MTYDEDTSTWVVRLRLTVASSSAFVPATTDWYVLIDAAYPLGLVEFHPAEVGGLHSTFRHMKRNESKGRPWRTGVPCLDRPGRWLGNAVLTEQPTSAYGKIRFHAESALRWLEFAARDALTDAGERFELPTYNSADYRGEVVGFDESPDRYERWRSLFGRYGRSTMRKVREDVFVLDSIMNGNGVVHPPRWGTHISELSATANTFWLALPQMPVVAPWDIPRTWGGLRACVRAMGINLDEHLKHIYRLVRADEDREIQILFVGFPIPDVFDGPPIQMHWQPLVLPKSVVTATGPLIRASDKVVWNLQWARTLSDDTNLVWQSSENWSEDTLRIRGSLHESVRKSRIVLIGGGSLASALAEMIVREGVNDLVILEFDRLEVGNLRRHVLTLNEVTENKGVALAKHLNSVSPFAKVRSGEGVFPSDGDVAELHDADIIIDCTANEDVIGTLARRVADGKNRWYFGGSVNLDADRFFLYSEFGPGIDAARYHAEMAGPLAEERRKIAARDLKDMQKAGCFNPVFPARWSDIQVRAAEMLHAIEDAVASGVAPANPLEIFPPNAA
jgi:hypothetical protein